MTSIRAAGAPSTAPSTQPDPVTVSPRIAATIDGALKYLSSKQLPSGSFSDNAHQAAITSYCLLAFLSAGNLPSEGPYAAVVDKGEKFLLSCVHADGYIAAPVGENNMYGHGISCIVLGELYGQTKDPTLRPKLERAIHLIVNCQNPKGGWRYRPVPADADISVTVLQVVALRVARNAGLDVPQATIDRAVAFIKSCADKDTGGFRYQPDQPGPGFARTAAAVYSLQMCGLYDDPLIAPAQKYLFEHRRDDTDQWFAYGHFYAAPSMYMIGGQTWQEWYPFISSILLNQAQHKAGVTYWGQGADGWVPVWTTAVFTTVLAMPYHYVPIYQR